MVKNEDKVDSIAKSVQTLTYLIIFLVVAVGFLFVKDVVKKPSPEVKGIVNQEPTVAAEDQEMFPLVTKYPKLEKTDYVRGDKNAKYMLIEYSDYECPFCKVFHETMLEFVKSHKDFAWVYRHFPLESIHTQAKDQAIAAECVGKIGGSKSYWEFSDLIFENTTSNDGLDMALLPEFTQQAGVDVDKFNNCFTNKETLKRVEAHLAQAAEFGVNGTPNSFLINTKTKKAVNIPGALPLAQMEEAFSKIR